MRARYIDPVLTYGSPTTSAAEPCQRALLLPAAPSIATTRGAIHRLDPRPERGEDPDEPRNETAAASDAVDRRRAKGSQRATTSAITIR